MASILVAEDEESVRAFVSRALEHAGHTVTAVGDGMQAVDALHRDRFDLLVTDIVMPQMDGITLALKATKDWPDMAVLLMTGFAAERQRAHNLEALIHKVISKPFEMADFLAAVDEALAARPQR
ncbi:MAG: response regulator [Alphaproteobacteria bacterium]|nr:response regulator [Alphaproteobacteria bacterium]